MSGLASQDMQQRIDRPTLAGWAMILMPVLTMCHEIGGHAAMCAAQGGRVEEIGAFYVRCTGLIGVPDVLVACAGAAVNVILSAAAFLVWRRLNNRPARLTVWLIWITQAFVAAGYLAFSGLTGVGDFGIGRGGALAGHGLPAIFGYAEAAVGVGGYVLLVKAGASTLAVMFGNGPASLTARRTVTRTYYATSGAAALLVGLLNPIGLFVTVMSAAASTFGGLAGLFRVGSKVEAGGPTLPFELPANRIVLVIGVLTLAIFAIVLGPGWRPQ